MKYLSVCSGIEAASVAWHPLSWTPVAFAETEVFPRAVLAHHYPNVPNFGDVNRWKDWPDAVVDVLVGGTPCQSFSVAGLRRGMADPRGNLALVYLAIADRYRPEWLVWENVPGVLSSNGGRDFAAFIGGLEQLGYHASWRVLDAQYVRVDGFARAVPQRRRRVFVVGHSRDWRRAAAVLFERESLQGHPAPRRQAGQRVAPTISVGTHGSSGHQYRQRGNEDALIVSTGDVSHCLNAGGMGRIDYETETMIAHSLKADGFDASRGTPLVPIAFAGMAHAGSGWAPPSCPTSLDCALPLDTIRAQAIAFDARQSDVIQYGDMTGPLDTDGHTMAVAFHENQRGELTVSDTAGSLKVSGGKPGQGYPAVQEGWAVRRLTPLECERLQGFPDGYTAVPYRGKLAADGPRYKALGNSMAVNCMRWLGRRIELVAIT